MTENFINLLTIKRFNGMKNFFFVFCFMLFTTSIFAQQFLWSTKKDTASIRERFVPLANVTNEALTYYDLYRFYLDLTGFNKDGFYEIFKEAVDNPDECKEIKEKIDKIEDLTVFAFKGNSGQGSFVAVMSISKINVNIIMFTNNPEPGCIMTFSSERDKFAKWFKTLLK